MRLSDIKGDRVFDAIADIIEPACNIATDPVASKLFRPEKVPEGMTATEFAAKRASEAVPALLRGHKDDLVTIFATLGGVTPDEYRESLTMAVLMRDFVELMSDEDMRAFLA